MGKFTFFLLTITPDACQGLLISRRVPIYDRSISIDASSSSPIPRTWVEENKSICPNQIDSTSASFAAQKKDEFLPFRVIELVNELLSFGDAHSTIQAEETVPARWLTR